MQFLTRLTPGPCHVVVSQRRSYQVLNTTSSLYIHHYRVLYPIPRRNIFIFRSGSSPYHGFSVPLDLNSEEGYR